MQNGASSWIWICVRKLPSLGLEPSDQPKTPQGSRAISSHSFIDFFLHTSLPIWILYSKHNTKQANTIRMACGHRITSTQAWRVSYHLSRKLIAELHKMPRRYPHTPCVKYNITSLVVFRETHKAAMTTAIYTFWCVTCPVVRCVVWSLSPSIPMQCNGRWKQRWLFAVRWTLYSFSRIGKHYARQTSMDKNYYIMWMIFRQRQFTGRRNISHPRIAHRERVDRRFRSFVYI